MGDILSYVQLGVSVLVLIFSILLIIENKKLREAGGTGDNSQNKELSDKINLLSQRVDMINKDADSRNSTLRSEISTGVVDNVSRLGDSLRDQQEKQLNSLTAQLGKIEEEFGKVRNNTLEMLEKIQRENAENMEKFRSENKQNLGEVQQKLDKSRTETTEVLEKVQAANTDALEKLRADNKQSLDKINDTVNEKLQKTLNDRISQSFEMVNKRLTEVYQGLGEMKQVAEGVTDLKKVLSNVKNRGILGEIQLGAILADILSPEQYSDQVKVKENSSERVDFAVKLPGTDNGTIWLPIDSKFPGDTYRSLQEAYENGNPEEIKSRKKDLAAAIKSEAKSISEKYINPPSTTDFAIMFLPFEGLYAEVINLGLVEQLQKDYKINVAGPSTMAAMLNSLRMGFRTLEIQEKSSQVWSILEATKKEFANFGKVLDSVRQRLNQADQDLEKLIGTRTKAIEKRLKDVVVNDDDDKIVLNEEE